MVHVYVLEYHGMVPMVLQYQWYVNVLLQYWLAGGELEQVHKSHESETYVG
jgi:hypothetical protein